MAAKKAKLGTKKMTLTQGKSKVIKVKNKKKGCRYTFSSSKKKVATVTKKGESKGSGSRYSENYCQRGIKKS